MVDDDVAHGARIAALDLERVAVVRIRTGRVVAGASLRPAASDSQWDFSQFAESTPVWEV
jgi:hypothetical protein